MRRVVMILTLLLVIASPAFAQAPEHHGFTVFANLGVGFQHDSDYQETAMGVGGANFGIGGFVSKKVAILGRFSGTSAIFDASGGRQSSGVYGGSVQYWINKWATVEGGAGWGVWTDEFADSDSGVGLIIAFHASVFQRGAHHVRVGVEWAPVFTDITVNNVGIVVGYQFAR